MLAVSIFNRYRINFLVLQYNIHMFTVIVQPLIRQDVYHWESHRIINISDIDIEQNLV